MGTFPMVSSVISACSHTHTHTHTQVQEMLHEFSCSLAYLECVTKAGDSIKLTSSSVLDSGSVA